MLKLTGVGKLFGSRVVLRNVSLETQPGTVSLLVGANGAGKTTLLKIMAGLARPSAGTVERHCDPANSAISDMRPSSIPACPLWKILPSGAVSTGWEQTVPG